MSRAPKESSEKEKIGFELKNSTLDIDHNHGYNTTLNEDELLKKK